MAKLNSTKFLKNDEMFDLETGIVKLKYSDAIPLFKLDLRIGYTEGNVCKDIKNCELQS